MVTNSEQRVWIPNVPKEIIEQLATRIKPVVEFRDLGKCYIEEVNLFDVAYTWAPFPTTRAEDIKPLCFITTYHAWAYYGFFKPSIAEVLAQVPEELLEIVVAFEIVQSPETAEDLNKYPDAFDAGYHVATTQLYVRL